MAVRKALLRRLIWQNNDFGVMALSTNEEDSLVINIAISVSWLFSSTSVVVRGLLRYRCRTESACRPLHELPPPRISYSARPVSGFPSSSF